MLAFGLLGALDQKHRQQNCGNGHNCQNSKQFLRGGFFQIYKLCLPAMLFALSDLDSLDVAVFESMILEVGSTSS